MISIGSVIYGGQRKKAKPDASEKTWFIWNHAIKEPPPGS